MQSYYKSYQIYKDNYNMGQHLVIWTYIILIKPRVHLGYESMTLKAAIQGGAPQIRQNVEPIYTHRKNPMARKLTTRRNILVAKLVHIPRGKERRGNIPGAMTLKSSRNPNHPLLMEKLRRGKKHTFGCFS
jgi:hypothetical protein